MWTVPDTVSFVIFGVFLEKYPKVFTNCNPLDVYMIQ